MAIPTTANLEGFEFFRSTDEQQSTGRREIGLRATISLVQEDEPHLINLQLSIRLAEYPKVQPVGMERWLAKLLHRTLGQAIENMPPADR